MPIEDAPVDQVSDDGMALGETASQSGKTERSSDYTHSGRSIPKICGYALQAAKKSQTFKTKYSKMSQGEFKKQHLEEVWNNNQKCAEYTQELSGRKLNKKYEAQLQALLAEGKQFSGRLHAALQIWFAASETHKEPQETMDAWTKFKSGLNPSQLTAVLDAMPPPMHCERQFCKARLAFAHGQEYDIFQTFEPESLTNTLRCTEGEAKERAVEILKRFLDHAVDGSSTLDVLNRNVTTVLSGSMPEDNTASGPPSSKRRVLRKKSSAGAGQDDVFGQLTASAPKRRRLALPDFLPPATLQISRQILAIFNFAEPKLFGLAIEMLQIYEESLNDEKKIPPMCKDLFAHDEFANQIEAFKTFQNKIAKFTDFWHSIQTQMSSFKIWQARLQTIVPIPYQLI